jgi:Domain of unknown function (DUF4258)
VKTDALQQKIREHIRKGTYVLAKHAIERQKGRCINLPGVLYVLEHGRHEQEKDIFDVKTQMWKHAIRGKTLDGTDLRVIATFQEKMVIITLIRVN